MYSVNTREQLGEKLHAVKEIANRAVAEKRDFTAEERTQVKSLRAEADALRAQAEAQDEARAQVVKTLGAPKAKEAPKAKSFGEAFRHEAVMKYGADLRTKALDSTGSLAVPFAFGGPVVQPWPGLGILPLVTPVDQAGAHDPNDPLNLAPVPGSDVFSYVVESARTPSAAVVPEGQLKPTTPVTLTRVDAPVQTIATLSEPQPVQVLQDYALAQQVLTGELVAAVNLALERLILNGDTTDSARVTVGLLTAPGTKTQAFDTDAVTTLRRGLLQLQAAAYEADAIVLNPADLASLELATDKQGSYIFGSPATPGPRTLFGVPLVADVNVAAGKAIIGRFASVQLYSRQQVSVSWATPGDTFQRNQIVFRAEGRFGVGVTQPAGFVIANLSAAQA